MKTDRDIAIEDWCHQINTYLIKFHAGTRVDPSDDGDHFRVSQLVTLWGDAPSVLQGTADRIRLAIMNVGPPPIKTPNNLK